MEQCNKPRVASLDPENLNKQKLKECIQQVFCSFHSNIQTERAMFHFSAEMQDFFAWTSLITTSGRSQSTLFIDFVITDLPTCYNLFVTLKPIFRALLQLFTNIMAKNLSCSIYTFPAEVKQDDTLHLLFQLRHNKKIVLFVVQLVSCFCIFVLFVGNFAF